MVIITLKPLVRYADPVMGLWAQLERGHESQSCVRNDVVSGTDVR